MRAAWRLRAIEFLRAVLMCTAVALAVAVLTLQLHTVRVLSPSMEPTIAAGDVALVRALPTGELRVGMVVVARDLHGSLYLHRITSVRRMQGGTVLLRTKGDANPVPDAWVASTDEAEVYVMFARLPLGPFGPYLPAA